jgi:hypothetical protein
MPLIQGSSSDIQHPNYFNECIFYSWVPWIVPEFIPKRKLRRGQLIWSYMGLKGWGFEKSWFPAGKRRAGDWVQLSIGQACTHNESPIKSLDTKAQCSFLICTLRVMCPGPMRKGHGNSAFGTFQNLTYMSLHVTAPDISFMIEPWS